MAEIVVMYKTPKDPAAFDKHYAETHIPLAKKMPGLRKFQVSQGPRRHACRTVCLSSDRDTDLRQYGRDPESLR